jgi:hypothetical protein
MGLPGGTWDVPDQWAIGMPEDRIAITEYAQRRLRPFT